MYPNIFGKPVNLSCFPKLSGAMDAVYNPLETPFILEAKSLGVPAEGGLYMLVAQAVRASEIFLDTVYEPQLLEQVFTKIKQEKQNVVLIGMPGAGKTTIGGKLAKIMDRPLLDTDDLIEELAGKSPAEIIDEHGERYFREIESQVVRETASKTGVIIATGGGIILNNENVTALSENGRIFFIDRPLEDLLPTADRPLSATREAITQRYNERYDRYLACADVQICVTGDADHTAEQILEAL
jgi:shikimate dehydrogenase